MTTIPAYDAEAVATLRDLDRQRLLGHLRDQRPDSEALEERVAPALDEPPATAPADSDDFGGQFQYEVGTLFRFHSGTRFRFEVGRCGVICLGRSR